MTMFFSIARPIARATRDYGCADRPLFRCMILAFVIKENMLNARFSSDDFGDCDAHARATRDYGCAECPLFQSMILAFVMSMRVQRATTDVLTARCFNL
jgi:hypothetical protein